MGTLMKRHSGCSPLRLPTKTPGELSGVLLPLFMGRLLVLCGLLPGKLLLLVAPL